MSVNRSLGASTWYGDQGGWLLSIWTGIESAVSCGGEGDNVKRKLCQNFKHLNICEENGLKFQVLPLPLKTSDRRLGLPGYRGTWVLSTCGTWPLSLCQPKQLQCTSYWHEHVYKVEFCLHIRMIFKKPFYIVVMIQCVKSITG